MILLVLLLAAVAAAAQKPQESCGGCHGETVKDFLAHPHAQKGLSCVACHGESARHRAAGGNAEPDRVNFPYEIPALCGACHAGKGAATILEEYSASKHGRLVLEQAKVRAPHCGTCHGVHSVRQGKAIETQCRRCHAVLPGACSKAPTRAASVSCAACHSPHAFALRWGHVRDGSDPAH